jgi:multiple sugar transport system substrate-binding protein
VSRREKSSLFMVAALVVAACGGGGGSSASPAGSAVAPSVGASAGASAGTTAGTEPSAGTTAGTGSAEISGAIQVLGKYAEGADEVATTRYELFMSRYPDVQVTFTEADFDAPTFLAAAAAGETPDAIRMERTLLGTYISNGALEPLDTCITDFGVDMSQYREAAVSSVTFGGSVYAIPNSYDARIILVNDSVVEAAELTPEDIDTGDWEGLSQVNEQLMANEGGALTRIGFDPKLPEFLPLWAAINGASLLSEDGLTSNLDDPKVAEALDFAASLVLAHGDAASFFDFRGSGPGGVDFFGPENQFVADTVGAFGMEQWYLNVLAENSPDEGISFTTFKDKSGNDITYAAGDAWAIPAAAKNKEAACEFIRVITSEEAWYAASQARSELRTESGEPFTGVLSANRVADERTFADFVTEESAGAYKEAADVVVSIADTGVTVPTSPAAEEFQRIWQEAVQRVLNEGVSASDALADADQEAQDAIDSAQ